MAAPLQVPQPTHSSGGRLVSVDGRELPLRSVSVRAEAGGGLARTVLEQRFANPFAEPLTVTYQVPLPADGAVSGFAITVGDRRIVGEIERREAARERFEDAILEGRTAGLLDQERSALFTQELGNVPPGAEIRAELTIDQPLVFVGEAGGSWEWRFPTVVAPRYAGAEGRVVDAERVFVDVASGPLPIGVRLALAITDELRGDPKSPSHGILGTRSENGCSVAFADASAARLDRDVVIRWPVSAGEPGVRVEVARVPAGRAARDGAYGLITVVPPEVDDARPSVARDVIVLLDTSGSMSGRPLEQAKAVVEALIDSLSDEDQIELIAFAARPQRYRRGSVRATAREREAAVRWLRALEAGGGTEMLDGVRAALAPLRARAQRQVVLVTDGCIGFEREVIHEVARSVPAGSRVHTVGVGSAVNRSLTHGLAHAGNGFELCIGLDENADTAAAQLLARTAAPLIVDLTISGTAIARPTREHFPDVFARSPSVVALALRAQGGELVLRGQTPNGVWERKLVIPPTSPGEGRASISALWARERVEDLEARADRAAMADAEIERLGLEFSISTRRTSWVAISEEPGVDPTSPIRRVRMPHELPYGVSAEGIGLGFTGPALLTMTSAREYMGGIDLSLSPRSRVSRRSPRAAAPSFLREERSTVSRGRIAALRPGQVVVEIDLGEETSWDPEEWRTLRFADGSTVACQVSAKTSTASGIFPAGATLRLVLVPAMSFTGRPVALVAGLYGEIPLR